MASFKRNLGVLGGSVAVATTLLLIFTAAPAFAAVPTITSFTPNSGPAGSCRITITGTGFTLPPVTVVHFTGADAVLAAGDVVSATQINVTVPALAATGTITVQNADGPSAVSSQTFTPAAAPACAPTVTSFNPTAGPVGTAVNIYGTNLLNATAGFFNVTGMAVSVVPSSSASASQVTAIVPVGATTGPIRITTPVATSAASAGNFTVGAAGPSPTITSFSPTSGVVGTSVVITGTNFTNVTSVSFNNVNAISYTVNSSTQITATVPTGATTGPIRVTTINGTATSASNFTVTAAPLPTITAFTPAYALTGKVVTITGTNFSGSGFTTTSVRFNNVTATFTVNSATQITATVPATATTGRITVTTPGGTATSTTDFVVSVLHSRTVSLQLSKHLVAKGEVSAGGFSACVAAAEVKIQRMKSGDWKTVGNTITSSNGSFKTSLDDLTGKYRAKAVKVVLGGGANICSAATSPTRNHKH